MAATSFHDSQASRDGRLGRQRHLTAKAVAVQGVAILLEAGPLIPALAWSAGRGVASTRPLPGTFFHPFRVVMQSGSLAQ